MRRCALVVAAAVSLAATPARAGDPPKVSAAPRDDAADRAMDLFEKARARYREGKFKDAADLLRQAYALHPEPVLLFNLGRALEDLGDLAGAADAYERYLASEPNAPDRGAIAERSRSLRARIAEQERLRRERAAAEQRAVAAQESAERVKKPSPVPWILGGAGLAVVGAGAVFGLMARSKEKDAVDEPEQRAAAEHLDTAKRDATIANVLFAGGGALLAGGIVSFVLLRPHDAAVAIAPAPGGAKIVTRF